MAFNAENLSALLDQLETTNPPTPSPPNIAEFVKSNSARLSQLVDRGWPLDLLLQRLLDSCTDDQKKPSLKTLRTHYKKATCALAGSKKRRGRPRGSNKQIESPSGSRVRESLREFLQP